MGTRKRTTGRFQIEALEGRWAPGGLSGGVLGDRFRPSIGEEIPQTHAARPAPALVSCGSNSIRAGQEGNAVDPSPLQKVREA
jgi:hypothetical protein